MTQRERSDLSKLVRQLARVAKSQAAQRTAELLADFDEQLARIYTFDDDPTWQAATEAAEEAVRVARAQVAERCAELGIPKEFQPGVSFGWYGRGENATASRRVELRRVATSRLAMLEKTAKTAIEEASLRIQTCLIADGLTSEAAKAFLADMPSVEALMPTLDAREVGLLPRGAGDPKGAGTVTGR